MKARFLPLLVSILPLLFGGCASLVTGVVVDPAVENLQKQSDLELVCDGAPAYLLMIDSMVESDPASERMTLIGVKAYGAYCSALTACGREPRVAAVSDKAKRYGLALLSASGLGEALSGGSPEQLERALARCSKGQVASLFWGGFGWAVWLQGQQGGPASLAAFVKIEKIMLRVIELDEDFYHGGAHLFLGSYYASRPKMLGGDPEQGRFHFERALELSNRSFLAVQVAYAESYAKTMFDRQLYEKLLHEVLDYPLEQRSDLRLANVIARKRAGELLVEAEQFF